MRNKYLFVLILMVTGMMISCSTNSFIVRKNFHSRVAVEIQPHLSEGLELVQQEEQVTVPIKLKEIRKQKSVETANGKNSNHQVGFTERVIRTFYPDMASQLKPLFNHQNRKLHKVTKPTMDSDQVAGLILGILSLVSAIAGGLMIIGMASGNIWVYFVVGMILAVMAIVLGAVGKRFRLKGLSIAGLAIGIVVVIALLAMLIVFTVLGIL